MQNEDQLLDLLLSFIDRAIPNERFTLAGFSRGGYYARGVLHRRLAQVAGLLFVAPLIQREEQDLPQRTVLVRDQAALAEQDEWTRTVGKPITVTGITILRIVNGKVVEDRSETTVPSIGEQLEQS